MEDTREKMLEALLELHNDTAPLKPSARRSRPPIEQRPSQEALLPNARVSATYGSESVPSNNEEESVVDDFLGDSETVSEIAPQTIETTSDPKGTENGAHSGTGGKGARKSRKGKPLSIA